MDLEQSFDRVLAVQESLGECAQPLIQYNNAATVESYQDPFVTWGDWGGLFVFLNAGLGTCDRADCPEQQISAQKREQRGLRPSRLVMPIVF